MAERTLHFDNAREAQEITGQREEYLPALEEASPFTEQALGADHRWRTAQQQQLAVEDAAVEPVR